ncbi:hypothetical protein BDF22DRAFT_668598 [Syncephalis plumigaleata]|nr:hypothetical protein BDF22DRAFT_668598 [Syncephalis plumigaleata]
MRAYTIASLVLLAATAAVVRAEVQLTEADEGVRANICAQNKGFCITNCGGEKKAPMNFCNPKTMAWNCGCSDKVPDLPDHRWPIVFKECEFRSQHCETECQKNPPTAPQCQVKCRETYNCNEGKMPPSHLRVDDVSAVPDYEGKASGSESSGKGSNAADSLSPSSVTLTYTAGALIAVAGAMLTL